MSNRPSTSYSYQPDEQQTNHEDDLPENFKKLRKVTKSKHSFKNKAKYSEKEEFEFNSNLIDKIYKYVYIVNDNFLTHPFIRLRKVIQLDRSTESNNYHLTPLTVIPIIFRIQSKFGLSGLYQGLTSVLITKGIILILESRLSEALDLNCVNYDATPETAIYEEFKFKTFSNQILLKVVVYCLATPFLCISTIDVIQSNLGFKNPGKLFIVFDFFIVNNYSNFLSIIYLGIFDFLNDSFIRTFSLNGHRTSRLIPIYLLIPPTVTYHTLHFITVTTIGQLTNFAIRSLRSKHDVQKNRRNKVYNEIICLIISQFIANSLFYPIETILNRLYVQGTRTLIDNLNAGIVIKPVLSNYQGFFDCKKAILQNESNLGFYKGIGSMFLQFSLQLLVMKITKTVIKNYF